MPTTRRKSGNPHSSSQSQSTLSFNNRSSRVTKPSLTDPTSANKKTLSKLSDSQEPLSVADVATPDPAAEPDSTEIAIRSSPQKAKSKSKSKRRPTQSGDEDARAAAEKVTDAQLKQYWKAEEDVRLAPRVHQAALPLNEKILRHFDLSSQYGPCMGLPRLRRWQRAHGLGLKPPVEVLAVLLREDRKGDAERVTGKMAYLDELANGKGVLVE